VLYSIEIKIVEKKVKKSKAKSFHALILCMKYKSCGNSSNRDITATVTIAANTGSADNKMH
jgi:uncharacterized protein YbbK (DUF523 family)